MGFIAIGISHKTAPLDVRERFSFTRIELREACLRLKQMSGIEGVIILSTCNRMEIYAHSPCDEKSIERIIEFLVKKFNALEREIRKYFYILTDERALRHIFRVASGLDSQVLGELEILGQVKSSCLSARQAGLTDYFLDALFEKAIDVGCSVRRDTKISHGSVSIGSVAMKMLKDHFEDLREKGVLIIGAGKIASLVSKYLKKEGIKVFFVSNRTHDKACELAKECGGEAVGFDRLKEKLKTVDIVISSTASPHIILRKEIIEEIMNTRSRPLLLLDLALPRDIDPEVKEIANVFLYDLDDLKYVIEESYDKRKTEALRVEKVIDQEVGAHSPYAANHVDAAPQKRTRGLGCQKKKPLFMV